MSSIKCSFCDRTFASRNGLSKHMSKCVLFADDEDRIIAKHSETIDKNQILVNSIEQDRLEIQHIKLDRKFSAKKILFKDINFHNTSQSFNEINTFESDFAGPSNLSDDNFSEHFADMSFELDDNTNPSNNFDINSNSNILNNFENTLQDYREPSEEISVNAEISEDIQNYSSDDNFNQEYDNFPNEAYADLMVLVTKYKLSNTASNAIISFFNKHSNHTISPLPKNITQGKIFMNNMKSNLLYKKTKVLDYNNSEYFLYHMPLISCIKNILEVPDISQNFALEYEELYKTTKV
jgi:hypothetical protein